MTNNKKIETQKQKIKRLDKMQKDAYEAGVRMATENLKPKQTTKGWEEGEITVGEALRWSDKHRKLSNNEGVRVIHIQQLLKRALASQRKDLMKKIKGMRVEFVKNNFYSSEEELDDKIKFETAYNQALEDIEKII